MVPDYTGILRGVALKKVLEEVNGILSESVQKARIARPDGTRDQIKRYAEGQVKHALRKKIGVGVDLAWSYKEFRVGLREKIDEHLDELGI